MHNEFDDHYNPNYPYIKDEIDISTHYGHPMIERTNNGLVFPECPKDSLEFEQMKDSDDMKKYTKL